MTRKPPLTPPTHDQSQAGAQQASNRNFSRNPAAGGRVQALNRLHAELAALAQRYDSEAVSEQRVAVSHALLRVVDYLTAQGFSLSILLALQRPVSALVEREQNRLDPLFCQRQRGGRPARSQDELRRIGVLAVLADAWLQLNQRDERSLDQKLGQAARRLSGECFGQVTGAELKGCRETVSQEATDNLSVIHAAKWRAFIAEKAKESDLASAFGNTVWMLNSAQQIGNVAGYGKSKTPDVLPNGGD